MLIKVRTLTGKEIELDIEQDYRVSQIKEKVEEKEGPTIKPLKNTISKAAQHYILFLLSVVAARLPSCSHMSHPRASRLTLSDLHSFLHISPCDFHFPTSSTSHSPFSDAFYIVR